MIICVFLSAGTDKFIISKCDHEQSTSYCSCTLHFIAILFPPRIKQMLLLSTIKAFPAQLWNLLSLIMSQEPIDVTVLGGGGGV